MNCDQIICIKIPGAFKKQGKKKKLLQKNFCYTILTLANSCSKVVFCNLNSSSWSLSLVLSKLLSLVRPSASVAFLEALMAVACLVHCSVRLLHSVKIKLYQPIQ